MSQLNPADLKPHLSLATDYNGDDVRLQALIDAAEDRICKYLRRDLDTEFPGGWPAGILQAVKVLVAYLDLDREGAAEIEFRHGLPFSVTVMLEPERNLEA